MISGPLKDFGLLTPEEAETHFRKFRVDYDRFCEDPLLLMDPLTVYKLDGLYDTTIYHRYHSWITAAPCILSHIAFGKPITESGLKIVVEQSSPQAPVSGGYNFIRGWWGRSASANPSYAYNNRSTSPPRHINQIMSTTTVIPIRSTSPLPSSPPKEHRRFKFAKSLRMTHDQLKSLELKKGVNHITFAVSSAIQGKQTCSAKIFFWDHDTKIVISDVDGTITKSDVLGHVFTMV